MSSPPDFEEGARAERGAARAEAEPAALEEGRVSTREFSALAGCTTVCCRRRHEKLYDDDALASACLEDLPAIRKISVDRDTELRDNAFIFDAAFTTGDVQLLGLAMAATGGHRFLQVDGVAPGGLAEQWNSMVKDEFKITSGARIVEVNGLRADCRSLWEQFKPEEPLRFKVLRPALNRLRIRKEGRKLGMTVQHLHHTWCEFLKVDAITDGAVLHHNEMVSAGGGVKLAPGDLIVEVNGVTGSPTTLVDALAAFDPLDFAVISCPPESTEN